MTAKELYKAQSHHLRSVKRSMNTWMRWALEPDHSETVEERLPITQERYELYFEQWRRMRQGRTLSEIRSGFMFGM